MFNVLLFLRPYLKVYWASFVYKFWIWKNMMDYLLRYNVKFGLIVFNKEFLTQPLGENLGVT